VRQDARAAEIVAATAGLTLAPLTVTLTAHLRAADLPRLRGSGRFGELLARQGRHTAITSR
jgi:hypothetical protein